MKRYKVIKNGIETNGWLSDSGLDEKHYEPGFGKPERWVTSDQEDVSQAIETRQVEVTPAVVDKQGQVIEPAVFVTEYKLAAEYEIVIEDLTQEIEAQKQKELKAKLRQEKLQKYDVSTKLNTLTNVAKVKEFLADLLPELLETVANGQYSTVQANPQEPSFAYFVNTLQTLPPSGAIVLNNKMRQIVYITGDKQSVTLNAIRPISNGFVDGQEVKIVGRSDANAVTVLSSGNVRLNGTMTIGDGEALDLFWDSSASVWRESSRSE